MADLLDDADILDDELEAEVGISGMRLPFDLADRYPGLDLSPTPLDNERELGSSSSSRDLAPPDRPLRLPSPLRTTPSRKTMTMPAAIEERPRVASSAVGVSRQDLAHRSTATRGRGAGRKRLNLVEENSSSSSGSDSDSDDEEVVTPPKRRRAVASTRGAATSRRGRGRGGRAVAQAATPRQVISDVARLRRNRPPQAVIRAIKREGTDINFVSDIGNATYLSHTIKSAPVARFLKKAVDYHKKTRGEMLSLYSVTKNALDVFKLEATNHLYRVLVQFVVAYTSMRADITKNSIIVIQGSFFPDFIRAVDAAYNETYAVGFCPENENTPTIRGNRGYYYRGMLEAPDDTVDYGNSFIYERNRRNPTKSKDASCVLVSNNKRYLSKKFFDSLAYFLREHVHSASYIDPVYRFSINFAMEVNQAYVYLLFKALDHAMTLAKYRSKRQVQSYRIIESDVQWAFSLLQPAGVRTSERRPALTSRR